MFYSWAGERCDNFSTGVYERPVHMDRIISFAVVGVAISVSLARPRDLSQVSPGSAPVSLARFSIDRPITSGEHDRRPARVRYFPNPSSENRPCAERCVYNATIFGLSAGSFTRGSHLLRITSSRGRFLLMSATRFSEYQSRANSLELDRFIVRGCLFTILRRV
jgi:hypothetical protein